MSVKQMEVTEKKIGEATFYIRPFPAFVAANISGELSALIGPMLGGIAPIIGNAKTDGKGIADIMSMDMEDALPAFSNAFSSLSGDKFERLMRQLLVNHGNISVSCEATNDEVKKMTYDLANEVFCGEVQDMFLLCFEVVKINFGGFFKKLGARFGVLQKIMQAAQAPKSENTEPST